MIMKGEQKKDEHEERQPISYTVGINFLNIKNTPTDLSVLSSCYNQRLIVIDKLACFSKSERLDVMFFKITIGLDVFIAFDRDRIKMDDGGSPE